ncbi:MAG: outer membrane beta-barrel protein [Altibacter sp.]|uniref:outer membrane beta-barrel protein n=1 Tax=Altibacter sp. TaxID=2024823 RepID=UPI001E07B052|nr:outer membrane beta-barrel protein [Altibacter sp.]MBZ0327786.1 outer membrane beta-barrel protein [Altibacter sp.]
MKEKKHIDQLFKDRFKNFEASPSPQVWEQIQAKLKEEKEDRKVIPLWWKLSGVAALLAILLTVGVTVFNPFDTNNTITTETEDKTIPDPTHSELQDNPLNNDYINETVVASEENDPSTKDASEAAAVTDVVNAEKEKDAILKKSTAVKSAVAIETGTEKDVAASQKKAAIDNLIKKDASEGISTKKEAVAINTEAETTSEKNKTAVKKELGIEETTKVVTADTDTNRTKNGVDPKTEAEASKIEEESKKRSILDAINEKNEVEAIAKTSDKPKDRWDVAPNFAPVYYNSLGEGSSIDPSFADNNKKGDVNFSYGVQVSYALSNRLKVRSGVSNVDLSYATSGLELGTAPVSAALKSIDYGGRQVVVTALDKGTFAAQSGEGNPFDNIMPKSTSGDVELIQNISYYEVPLELTYAVVNNKFGINLIGGFSTLFLGNNEVSVQAGDFNDTLGEANNLSSVSFTTNVGLGFDYKISKKFTFNIEPMFKYQLNPYTDSSVDFKPYYVGIYSGLSFKF